MYAKSSEKRESILEGARRVFLRKRFAEVSMTDIIEECKISRGGLYFYFSSVDEIFVEVISSRNRTTEDLVDRLLMENSSFTQVVDDYFAFQKERLMQMDKSLLAAMIEYGFSHDSEEDRQFVAEQYEHTKKMVRKILGFNPQAHYDNPEILAEHIMYTIEGLSIMALTVGIEENVLDNQFALLRTLVLSGKEGITNEQ